MSRLSSTIRSRLFLKAVILDGTSYHWTIHMGELICSLSP